MKDTWETPAKSTPFLRRSRGGTPHQPPPGLHPEELGLWGSGIARETSSQSQTEDSREEAQLLARLAELKAKKQRISPPTLGLSGSGSFGRSTYDHMDLWGQPQERRGTASVTASSTDFIVPRHDDVNASNAGRTIRFLTKPLVIDKVEEPTYENLVKMKEQVQQGYRDGYSRIEKKGYFGKIALRTIEDNLARIYEEHKSTLFYENRTLPDRTPYDWLEWEDTRFFGKIPQLMRLEHAIQDDPISDCLAQLPTLTYSYDVKTNTGEARFHDDTLTVFRTTLVWVSETENERSAIWMTDPVQGKYWLRNILKELNIVISRGKGPTKQVAMISVEMNKLEKSHASGSFTEYIKRFKLIAHKRRVEALR